MGTRRAFIGWLATGLTAALPRPGWARARPHAPGPHPTPRPGIDASKVLTAADLGNDAADVLEVFDKVREIPQVVDGIRCHCGCADLPGFYSLLSCYEEAGMARMCFICQGQGRMAHRLHKAGSTLDEIREAIDARYG